MRAGPIVPLFHEAIAATGGGAAVPLHRLEGVGALSMNLDRAAPASLLFGFWFEALGALGVRWILRPQQRLGARGSAISNRPLRGYGRRAHLRLSCGGPRPCFLISLLGRPLAAPAGGALRDRAIPRGGGRWTYRIDTLATVWRSGPTDAYGPHGRRLTS